MRHHTKISITHLPALLTAVLLTCMSLCCCSDDEGGGSKKKATADSLCHIAIVANHDDKAQWELAVELFRQKSDGCTTQLEIDWYDEQGNIDSLSECLSTDPAIDAVIGFSTSEDAMIAADHFVRSEKPLLLPVATATSLHRKYSEGIGVWFMAEDDAVQCDLLVNMAYNNGAQGISLFYPDSDYGNPYSTALEYSAKGLGLPIDKVQKYDDNNFEDNLRQLLHDTKSYVICVVNNGKKALTAARINAELGIDARRLIFSDGALDNSILTDDSNLQLEGVCLSAHPESGFVDIFADNFGTPPASGLAQLYDALTLVTLGHVLSRTSNCSLNSAILSLLTEYQPVTTISATAEGGLARAEQQILDGIIPHLEGATGQLYSAPLLPTTIPGTYYAHWVRGEGMFNVANIYTASAKDLSMAYSDYIGLKLTETDDTDGKTFDYPILKDQWVVLVAASSAWQDLRHQVDVLRLYQWLHSSDKGGFNDDHIILIADTTMLRNPKSPTPGRLMLGDNGTDLTAGIDIDYATSQITTDDLCNILTGNRTDRTPVVLPSSANDNVMVFWCGHGFKSGLELGKQYSGNMLTQKKLAATLQEMSDKNMYRKMLWLMEACYAGYTATAFEGIHGAMAITSSDHEESFAYMFSPDYGLYVSNRFSAALYYDITQNPLAPLIDTYHDLARFTIGSHVKMVNQSHFDNLRTTSISEFTFNFYR